MMTMTTMRRPLDAPSSFFARSSMMTRRHLHHRHHNPPHHHQRAAAKTKTTTSAGFLFGKPKDAGETATKESLQYELDKANEWREELGEELRRTKKERDDAMESAELYKRRLKEAEKDVFKLEKLTQEQEQKFNAFEIVVKKQIKLLEGMVKERDEQLAKTQQK